MTGLDVPELRLRWSQYLGALEIVFVTDIGLFGVVLRKRYMHMCVYGIWYQNTRLTDTSLGSEIQFRTSWSGAGMSEDPVIQTRKTKRRRTMTKMVYASREFGSLFIVTSSLSLLLLLLLSLKLIMLPSRVR